MKARTTVGGFLVALVCLSSAAMAQDWRDLRLAQDVVSQINTYTRFTIFDDVSIRAENGLVTLTT